MTDRTCGWWLSESVVGDKMIISLPCNEPIHTVQKEADVLSELSRKGPCVFFKSCF